MACSDRALVLLYCWEEFCNLQSRGLRCFFLVHVHPILPQECHLQALGALSIHHVVLFHGSCNSRDVAVILVATHTHPPLLCAVVYIFIG